MIESLQQGSIEIDVPAALRDEKCGRHRERAAAHVSDHQPESVARRLGAQRECLGQATALVELDVDVLITPDERVQGATIRTGLIGGERHPGKESVERLVSESDTRLRARQAQSYPFLKLKLDAERHIDIIRIVREECPAARVLVDANEAWSRSLLERLLPKLQSLAVELIEQPVARGDDESLDGLLAGIPLAADESCTDRRSLEPLIGRYQYINIKLDKCGGLTEGLAMVREARRLGLGVMVGNMMGSSLAMAPSFVVGQLCDVVDLDGPTFLAHDRVPAVTYLRGMIWVDEAVWGRVPLAPGTAAT